MKIQYNFYGIMEQRFHKKTALQLLEYLIPINLINVTCQFLYLIFSNQVSYSLPHHKDDPSNLIKPYSSFT